MYSWIRVSSRRAYSRRGRPMSDSSWKERSGGRGWPGGVASATRAASRNERAVSERSVISEPTLTTARGAELSTVPHRRSRMGRQGWEGRSASRMPSRSGANSPTRAGTPAVRSSWNRRVSDAVPPPSARNATRAATNRLRSVGRPRAAQRAWASSAEWWRWSTRSRRAFRCAVRSHGVEWTSRATVRAIAVLSSTVMSSGPKAGPSGRAGSMITRPQRSPWYSTGAVSQPAGPHVAVGSAAPVARERRSQPVSASATVPPDGSQISAWCVRFSRTTVRPHISAAARTTSSGPAPRRVRAVNASWMRWVRRIASAWLPSRSACTTWVTSRKLTSWASVTRGRPRRRQASTSASGGR
ncbi:hypothetical protein ADL01_34005 [Streptomyces sp. NRRL WC-3618]|nr:hypothetical protein ADL01_34005 [Streptomyces sp. NRRL WC-3618]